MAKYVDLEERLAEIGEAIFEAIKGDVPAFFDMKKWKGKVMDWAMKDERFKIQLFRFVDALPSLRHDRDIPALIDEYFFTDIELLPHWLKRWVPKDRILGAGAGLFVKKNVEAMAKQFIAGKDPNAALKKIEKLRSDGRTFTVDLLGEAVLSESEAQQYAERYLDLIEVLSERATEWADTDLDRNNLGSIPKTDISLKVSSFYSRLDPMAWNDSVDGVVRSISPVIERAIKRNVSVTFDMEHYQFKDITLEIFKRVLDTYPDLEFAGIAIQTYLKDAEDDLTSLIECVRERGRVISVRLVKGAYWNYEKVVNRQAGWPVPVFLSKSHTDHNFEKLTGLLLANTDVIRPAIASHNIRSISKAMALAEKEGLPKEALEFQALYGMAEPIKKVVSEMGYRVREYMPVGELLPGMAYFVRRLLENTSNESFLRQSFVDKLEMKELMAKPEAAGAGPAKEMEGFVNTPLTNFAKAEMRELFKKALDSVREEIKASKVIPCVIGGEEVVTGKEIISYNPARHGEVVATISAATPGNVEEAVGIARDTFGEWSRTPAIERAGYLYGAARWIEDNRYEIAALQVYEVGKSWREADADVAEALDFLNYYGDKISRIAATERLGSYPGELNMNFYVPRGVAAVISPWNFPLAISCGMTAAAIAAGNCAILKPSSLSPLTAFKLVQAFESAGLPKGVLQYLPGSGAVVGNCLVEHRDVDIIAFTGSMKVGLDIVKKGGVTVEGQANVKKVIAEMGGKNAIIVDKSADMDEVVKGVVASFTGFQGQKCSACSRVIVLEDAMEDFLDRLTEAVKSITVGSPEDPASMMGPVVDSAALEKIRGYIETGKEEATLHYINEALPNSGHFVGPAIFRDVRPDCRIAREEIFGPVLSVIKAADFDEALEIANGTPYALTGGIYSRSPENIKRGSREFMVGNLYINRKITGAIVGRQPFGGFRMSGLGSKAGGRDYLLHFMYPKIVTENTLRRGFAPEVGNP